MSRAKRKRAKPAQALVDDRIDTERRQLQKASAVLGCLAYAAHHDADIQAGDAAAVAQELIDACVTKLDPLYLQRPAAENEGVQS